MASVAIVTANYGGFDAPRAQATQDIDIDWLYYTDEGLAPGPWVTIYEPGFYDDPRMSAKLHKTTPPAEHRFVIWIDANTEITNPTFARNAIACTHDGVAAFRHPRRDCIYQEAIASLGAEGQGGKYAGMPIMEQVEQYRTEGHPEHGGLFACGTVAWDLDRSGTLGREWLDECERWTVQDQLSFPVVCRRAGVRPGAFPHAQLERRPDRAFGNRWLIIHGHGQ